MDNSGSLGVAVAEELRTLQQKLEAQGAEQRRLEEALRHERDLRGAIVDALQVPVFHKNRSGLYDDCNDAFVAYMGMPRERIIGHSVEEVAPPDLARKCAETDAELLTHPGTQRYQAQLGGGDSAARHIVFIKTTVVTQSGEVNGIVGAILDVTDCVERENALRAREVESRRTAETLNTLLHLAPTPIIVIDPDDHVMLWNKAAERVFGWTEAEVLGKPSPLTCPHTVELACSIRARTLAGEAPITWEGPLPRKDGGSVDVAVLMAPERDLSGTPTRVLAVCVDQTQLVSGERERERLIRQLQGERLRLSAVLQHMPAGAFIAEAPTGRIVMTNDAAASIWQMPFTPAESVADYPPLVGYRPDGTQYERDDWPLIRSLVRGEVVRNEQIRIVRGDGGCAVILANSAPIRDSSGKITSAAIVFVDISEQARIQDQLRASEARYRSLVEHLPGTTYVTPLDDLSAATYTSPQVEELTGYTPGDFRADPNLWRSLYLPEDRERLVAESRRFQRHKRSTTFDYRIRRKDGAVIWVRDEATYVRDDAGRPVCVQGILMDNTARVAEREKRRREQQLLLESQRIARTGSWEMDLQSGGIQYTPEVRRILGIKAGESLPDREERWRMVHPEDVQRVRTVVEGAISERHPYHIVHRLIRRDGREIIVRSHGVPCYDKAGRPLRLVGTFADITEWHKAGQERRTLAQLIENSSDIISMADTTGRLTFVNSAGRRLLGISRRQLEKGLTTTEITAPPCAPLLRDVIIPTVMSIGHWEGEVQLLNLRTRKPIEGYASVFQVPPEEVSQSHVIAAIVRDTRERRRAEQAVLAAADREQQRVGMDLHDLVGQTLTGAAMLGTTLQRKLAARHAPEAEQAARISQLLIAATNQTRELARGLCPVSDGPEALRVALGELAKSTREIYGIDCSARASSDALVEDATIAGQIYFIAREAVANAIKHGESRTIRIQLHRADHGLELRVEDDGKGFIQNAQKTGGLGFRTMRYRAGIIGAQLSLEQGTSGGVIVRCRVPEALLGPSRARQEARS